MEKRLLKKIIKILLKEKIKTKSSLEDFKRRIAKRFKIPLLKNTTLLETYQEMVNEKEIKRDEKIEEILKTRPIRSLSGIVNVSVLTKPYSCPGSCIFCPKENGVPKSYLKKEPAVQRAILNKYLPYFQLKSRLDSLKVEGHPCDKIELRIIGGTWSFYPKSYQTWFIKECFRAANEYGQRKSKKRDLFSLQKRNEKASSHIVGISIETRPDFINEDEIKRLRILGITQVELGVQSIYDDVLEKIKRGHSVQATIEATRALKDAGFKVLYQVMPNLPGSNLKRDILMFKEIFENQNFKPDFLKIYPLALLKNTPLYLSYKKGMFRPYTLKELLWLLFEIKKMVPFWCRIQRVVRDIPKEEIVEGGVKVSNLRELVQKKLKEKGLSCRCIRCREIMKRKASLQKIYLFREDYQASFGKEVFLSFEDKNRETLFGYLRLRLPSPKKPVFKVLENSAIIRELKVCGKLIEVGEKSRFVQHRGLGKKLVKEAQNIAKNEFKVKKLAVISGIGARDYWRKLGFGLKESYMVKSL
jgi:elongator complex protein 3